MKNVKAMAMPFVATVSVIANQEWVVIIVPVHYVNEIVMGMVLVNTKACVIAKTDGAANIVIKKRVQNSAMPWTVVLLLVFVKATVANVYQVTLVTIVNKRPVVLTAMIWKDGVTATAMMGNATVKVVMEALIVRSN